MTLHASSHTAGVYSHDLFCFCDLITFSGTTAVLVAVGVLAASLPAMRAARLDPAAVLGEG
jgi:hypothetical protein